MSSHHMVTVAACAALLALILYLLRASRATAGGSGRLALLLALLPDALLQSELFGYEKGAFTGAARRKPGRVDLAQGGTETLHADVRFVAATHRDLEVMVEEGRFREDLYYRLVVIPVTLPPLRARPGDVQRLAEAFCRRLAGQLGRPDLRLSDDALARLADAPWPGNVRQLENLVERLAVLSPEPVIGAGEVARELARRTPGGGDGVAGVPDARTELVLDARVRDTERAALAEAIERTGGNRTLAARLLGISRRTFYTKLAEHGLG